MNVSENVADYIKIYKFLEPEFCTELIKFLELLQWHQHSYYDHGAGVHHSYPDDFWINGADTFYSALLQKNLWTVINNYVQDVNMPWFNRWNGYSKLRFNKYTEGTNMKLHVDHIHSMFDGNIRGIPTLTLLGFLNSDFQGGDFLLCGETPSIQPGEVIVFPSTFMYPHEVTTVTSGTRYSFVSWVY